MKESAEERWSRLVAETSVDGWDDDPNTWRRPSLAVPQAMWNEARALRDAVADEFPELGEPFPSASACPAAYLRWAVPGGGVVDAEWGDDGFHWSVRREHYEDSPPAQLLAYLRRMPRVP